jgi:hypothetical protein
MRYAFAFLFLVHGLIHLMGFAKAFKYAEISQLTQPISKNMGVFWLLAAVLFTVATTLFLLQKDVWWMVAAPALLLSQYLIITSWQDAKFGSIANVLILIAVILGYSGWSYYKQYEQDVNAGLKEARGMPTSLLTEADLQPLPVPVQQYLRYVGAVGKPKIQHFKVVFKGQIRKNEQSEWMPFTSEQHNFMEPATRLFFMDATMKHLPVTGFHSFKNGEAFMDIRLLSLFKVQYQSGKEMGIAETVTFFNDMCCMAPATLIDKRIQWLETDGNKVKASFTNNGIKVEAWLYFNEQGQLVDFISEDRFASSDEGKMLRIPWSTPLKNYTNLHGILIPGYAETIYHYPEGNLCYGTFSVVDVSYN